MIDRIIQFSLKNRLLVSLFALLVAGGGAYALGRLPVDAFPDVTPVVVQVITESPGHAPEEVEQLITFPVEVAMNGLPGIDRVQSISMFGLSIVYVYFEDDVDIYFARQLALERLQQAKEQIPDGYGEPALGPISSTLGFVYQYVVEGRGQTRMELRTIQDWIIRQNLRTVPGVADVLSFGGDEKQYQVRVDPARLLQYDVTMDELMEALRRNNRNVGGGYIVRDAEEYIVRGLGLAEDLDAIGDIVVATRGDGTPVYVSSLADVQLGAAVRRGTVTRDGEGEVVTGIVLKRIGENTSAVIERIKQRVAEINRTLPAGVRVVPYYDQSELVARAVETVRDALLEGGLLVVLVLFLFLGNVRSALVVTAMLPLSVLLAFLLMERFGMSANLMSLGGLAIGIGMMVDGGVVMVENIYRQLSEARHPGPSEEAHAAGERWSEPRLHLIRRAAQEVGRPIVFGIAIIIVVFLPLFSLEGVEGKLFKPMAWTITFAMLGSLVFSLTVVPVLSSFFLKGGSEEDTWIMRKIKPRYLPVLDWALVHRRRTVGIAVAALAFSLALFPFLGTEFVPELDEGSIMVRATFAPSAGLNETVRAAGVIERMLLDELGGREIETVVSKIGRAEGGDPEGVNLIESYVLLRPHDGWRFDSKEELVEAIERTVARFPGVQFGMTQPIAMRVDEIVSGVKAQLAIKLFGDDLEELAGSADRIADVVRRVPGATAVQVEQVAGQPQLQVRVDREAIARYGLNVDDVLEVVEAAVGGEDVGEVFEGQRRFDIIVRLDERYRNDPASIANLLVAAPGGARVPLAQLAAVQVVTGPRQVSHEASQRRIVVQANVRGRDLGGFVAEAQQRVDSEVDLPAGYRVTWGGQFENQQRAMKRLAIIVPLTIALIFFLLFSSFGSLRQATLIILNVPFALIGGILGLFITRQYLSVPASVGFIALFGVAVLNGVVLVSYINQLRREGLPVEEAVRRGTEMRLRPVLMTALVAMLGLVPLLLSQGVGSEVQRPLATVVIGGILTSTLLTLVLLPTLYGWFERERVEF